MVCCQRNTDVLSFLQGHINLDSLGKRGYHIPKKGTVQVVSMMVNKKMVHRSYVIWHETCKINK